MSLTRNAMELGPHTRVHKCDHFARIEENKLYCCNCDQSECDKLPNSYQDLEQYLEDDRIQFPPVTFLDLRKAREKVQTALTVQKLEDFKHYELTGKGPGEMVDDPYSYYTDVSTSRRKGSPSLLLYLALYFCLICAAAILSVYSFFGPLILYLLVVFPAAFLPLDRIPCYFIVSVVVVVVVAVLVC